ncbi:MAG: hypothetical protein R6X16_15035 [Anaerolineae bacterium]
MRLHVTRVALALAIVAAGLLAPVSHTAVVEARGRAPVSRGAVVEARILRRYTILGKIFRLTPVGRVVATVEDRQDAYRAANNWLAQAQQENSVRQEQLRQALVAGKLDLRAYVHASATLLRHAEQYVAVTERMKVIGRDNFHRAMGQQAFERFMPRIAQSVGFAQRVDNVKGALEAGRQLLEQGALDIDRLAEKAYPQFMRDGRARVQELITKLDRAGLSGKPVEDIRRTLAGLERGLGALEKAVPEMVKTDDVKRLQQEARNAAQVLVNTGKALDDGVKRLRDKNTVYFPVRSLERDAVVKKAMEEFSTDPSLLRRAVDESKLRRALGSQLEEALGRCGVERSDPLYTRIRQRMLALVDVSDGAPSADALDALCAEAKDQITREAEQPGIHGTATLDLDLASLERSSESDRFALSWLWRDSYKEDSAWNFVRLCDYCHPTPAIQSLPIRLEVNLETREVQGNWSGTAEGQQAVTDNGVVLCTGDSRASFDGAMAGGSVIVDPDGLGFSFEGEGTTSLTIAGELACTSLPQEPKAEGTSVVLETTVSGEWRAGEGQIRIYGRYGVHYIFNVTLSAVPYEVTVD